MIGESRKSAADDRASRRPIPALAALSVASVLSLIVFLQKSAATQSKPAATSAYGSPTLVCDIDDPRLDEASGIVCGRRNSGVFYAHNDSGGRPEVYVIDGHGGIRAVFAVKHGRNIDWEDIALAPGSEAGRFDIVAADIGDNSEKRKDVQLYRFAEPELPEKSGATLAVDAQQYELRYPDGAHNAEALAIHPRTGDAYILSKLKSGRARVYRLRAPWPKEGVTTLELVGELHVADGASPLETMVTAGDISPDGRCLVSRSYLCGWEWELPTESSAFETIFARTPHRVALAAEQQGEGICYSPRGDAFFTIGEGSPTAVWRVDQISPSSAPANPVVPTASKP